MFLLSTYILISQAFDATMHEGGLTNRNGYISL